MNIYQRYSWVAFCCSQNPPLTSNYNPTVGIDILSNYPFHFCVIWTGLRDWFQISDAQRVEVWQIDIGNVFSVTFGSTNKAFMPGIRVGSSYWKHFLLLFVTRKKTESAYILDSKMRIDGVLFPKTSSFNTYILTKRIRFWRFSPWKGSFFE